METSFRRGHRRDLQVSVPIWAFLLWAAMGTIGWLSVGYIAGWAFGIRFF